jgi:beta-lysine 5,6-aminomutase beta subunit
MAEQARKKIIKPYGDSMGDGAVQVSFTLPGVSGEIAEEAARRLAGEMGIDEPFVASSDDIGSGMTFIVLYGKLRHSVDVGRIKGFDRAAEKIPNMKVIDHMIEERLGRVITAVGACIESDAHTVGIDAIMNMKGFAGDYGLERYKNFRAINMGAQVSAEEVVREAVRENADVILVSQVVTQKEVHVRNLTRLVDLLEAEHVRDRVILIVGGPRITRELAKELGFDAGFGRGTLPSHVAWFIANRLIEKEGKA